MALSDQMGLTQPRPLSGTLEIPGLGTDLMDQVTDEVNKRKKAEAGLNDPAAQMTGTPMSLMLFAKAPGYGG